MADALSCLEVLSVDCCYIDNGLAHHTSPYSLMDKNKSLVVRRGQPFKILVDLDRSYFPDKDDITLTFYFPRSHRPSIGKGTYVSVPVTRTAPVTNPSNCWFAVLTNSQLNEGKQLEIEVYTAPYTIVGIWCMEVDTQCGKNCLSYSEVPDIYILFNPWCQEDQVFLPDEGERQEYVMSDVGKLYKGSVSRRQPCGWVFGQFETNILECSLALIHEIGQLDIVNCNNPIRVARTLSYMVNARQQGSRKGVLLDKEGVEYEPDTTDPNVWSGSKTILQRYYDDWVINNKDRTTPVRYGSCWVFAGVLTTVCRALGLPARPVTIYYAGHDTKGSITIDEVYNDSGDLKDLSDDSIWTFHVFSEVWMKRPDLCRDGRYDGWNYLDATPLEKSDNRYQCGPASVKAVQKGEVYLNYDTEFVIGLVNSAKMYWLHKGNLEPLTMIRSDRSYVGHNISTKAVGSFKRTEITDSYKIEKGHDLKVLECRKHHMANSNYSPPNDDFKVTLKFVDDVVIGSDFNIVAIISNTKDEDMTVSYRLRVESTRYCGKIGQKISVDDQIITVPKRSSHEMVLKIEYKEYWRKLVNQCNFNVVCFLKVKPTGEVYIAKDTFRLRKPDLKFEVQGSPEVDKRLTLVTSFINPLPITIHDGFFNFEGAGLDLSNSVDTDRRSINPGQVVRASNEIIPRKKGQTIVAVKFFSHELNDAEGFVELCVK